VATDDVSFSDKYIFVGLETREGKILRVNKSDISQVDEINTNIKGGCVGTYYDGKNIWGVFNSTPGTMVRINPNTMKSTTFVFRDVEGFPNEIASDSNNLFVSFYTAPSKILKLRAVKTLFY